MKITKTNYELKFNLTEADGETTWFDRKKYQTEEGQSSGDDFYDNFIKKELNKVLKRASDMTFIGLSLIAKLVFKKKQ